MNCSTTGCGNAATLQWGKLLGPPALAQFLIQLGQSLETVAQEQRLSLRIRIAALQDAIANAPSGLSAADLAAYQAMGAAQLADLQQQLGSIPATYNVSGQGPGSYQSLFTCATHKQNTDDWYGIVHQPTCSGLQNCGCHA